MAGSLGGVHLSTEHAGVIIVLTDVNMANSLSGSTPLLIPLE